MTEDVSSSGGGAGVQYALSNNEAMILRDGVQIYSETASVITGGGGNNIVLSANSGVIGLSTSPAIAISSTTGRIPTLTIAETALVDAYGDGIVVEDNSLDLLNAGLIRARTDGIDVTAAGAYVVNHGVIMSGNRGVTLAATADIVNTGTITSSGAIGVGVNGDTRIENSGRIDGSTAVAMGVTGPDGNANRLFNDGVISGEEYGILIAGGTAQITNSGQISSQSEDLNFAIGVSFFAMAVDVVLVNSGLISSNISSYIGGDGVDLITNTGQINGAVLLGQNDDVYQGRQGRVEGIVSGDDGADLLVGGAEANEFDGGSQNDTLRGNGGDDDLDGEGGADLINGGAGDDLIRGGFSADRLLGKAGDDEIYGDEDPDRMFGGKGDDVMYGGSFSDVMFGGQGDDTLGGGNGFDTLHGGRGDDQLSGGAASDTFVLKRRSDDDVITDFQNGMDVVDLTAFGLRPAQFAGVVAPALNDAGGGATFLDLTQLGGNGSVLIEGLAFAQADASDFVL